MKCEEFLSILNDYVDGSIEPGICAEFDRHLAGCNPCRVVVDTMRKTITIYKAGRPYELPAAFRQRLHAALSRRWKEAHPRRGDRP